MSKSLYMYYWNPLSTPFVQHTIVNYLSTKSATAIIREHAGESASMHDVKAAVLCIFLSLCPEGAKLATSVNVRLPNPAEGPAYGLDFARRCGFPLRALQAQKWHAH